jgi:hypothetical protein
MERTFLLVGGLCGAAFCAWPIVGDARLPIAAFSDVLRAASLVFVMAALVVWEVKRRLAVAGIERVSMRRKAELPSAAMALMGGVAIFLMILTFPFDQRFKFEALVARNDSDRIRGALTFLERHPDSDFIDAAFDGLLEGQDYLEVAAKVYPTLLPDLRQRVVQRVLDRTEGEPPGKAGRDLAMFVTLFDGADAGNAARKRYVGTVVPRLLAKGPGEVSGGARALLRALAESAGGPRGGLVIAPTLDVPAPVASLADRLQRSFESLAPFQVVRGTGAAFIPRRFDVHWDRTGERISASVAVVASLGGGKPLTLFETCRILDLTDDDPHAAVRFADALIQDILPPP